MDGHFIICPILLIVLYAFSDGAGGFTLANFGEIGAYWPIFVRSFVLAFISTIICLAHGYPLAYLMSRQPPQRQQLYMTLIMLPMWMNFLLRTYAWMSILENKGFLNQFFNQIGLIAFLQNHFGYTLDYIPLINTSGVVVLGMVYNFLPFMVLPSTPCSSSSTPRSLRPHRTWAHPCGRCSAGSFSRCRCRA